MEGYLILALVVAIPIALFPAAYMWYLNLGAIRHAIREVRARKAAVKEAK